jgi:oligopeptide/dipeptide ABC transporter ATP-binding protein
VTDPLLRVERLNKAFTIQRGAHGVPVSNNARPIHDISFELNAGEIVTLVGEPGSGKSTLARSLAMLARPDSGKIVFEGRDLTRQGEGTLRPIRRRLQMLFSDPRTALNPASLVSEVMFEPLKVQRVGTPEQQTAAVKNALKQVGLNSLLLDRRMTALSTGERQRVALARLLTLNPALIICDDPARTLPPLAAELLYRLMDEARRKHGVAFLWLVGSLKAAALHADRIGVLYQGRLVELGQSSVVLGSPQHPYTRQLLAGPPSPAPPGPAPRAAHDPIVKGCPFHPHCPHVMDVCRRRMPEMMATPSLQTAACFLFGDEGSG